MNIEQRRCEVFNENNPVGSQIIYIDDDGVSMASEVKYAAQLLGGDNGPAVIWIQGKSGAVDFNRIVNRKI